MRIPNYYCPHCKKFKKWFQVRWGDYHAYCNHCDAVVAYTYDFLQDLVEEYIMKNKAQEKGE